MMHVKAGGQWVYCRMHRSPGPLFVRDTLLGSLVHSPYANILYLLTCVGKLRH
ncbi:hypothetical protein M404DRAFT_1004440 [Pisolithus tinctorius Marx 270]|uniref:Uncharacterized protein n=1 Tax=Pisolithus tinctorius Marx 270 TaxID=870435 RepID=A0A0C3NWG4_PISTI|nr:hypothetical protein M404DRAFT_1004440 [Pisolithus tinctorius Marx 270]